jgi:hypothetical protein
VSETTIIGPFATAVSSLPHLESLFLYKALSLNGDYHHGHRGQLLKHPQRRVMQSSAATLTLA